MYQCRTCTHLFDIDSMKIGHDIEMEMIDMLYTDASLHQWQWWRTILLLLLERSNAFVASFCFHFGVLISFETVEELPVLVLVTSLCVASWKSKGQGIKDSPESMMTYQLQLVLIIWDGQTIGDREARARDCIKE